MKLYKKYEEKINEWITTGLMVYSYSKRLLFEYIKCLPDNSNDVIHIETDGIYFSTRLLNKFSENINNYTGEYPVKFGEDLGNLKVEKSTAEGQIAYFLGKKFYCITLNNEYNVLNHIPLKPRDDNDKNIYRIRGMPQSTIDRYGNKNYIVDVALYDAVYNGRQIPKTFLTMKKNLFGNTAINVYEMTRIVRGSGIYEEYN